MVVTASAVIDAAARIRPHVRRTPLEGSRALTKESGAEAHLKLEHLQVTGSFKPRGAFNRLLTMTDEERARGVVAPTAGNHGLGLAHASDVLGVGASIYVPAAVDPARLRRLHEYGADVHLVEEPRGFREAALRAAEQEGRTFVSAYNDPAMVAGGGTVALEILEDLPSLDAIIVPVGGGGLIAGVATLLRAVKPNVRVWGVQPALSPVFARWLEVGAPIQLTVEQSIAEGLSGQVETSTITFPIIKQLVERVVDVSEEDLVTAMRFMLDEHQFAIEPSGAAAAAVLMNRLDELAGAKVAAVITGRNIGVERFTALLAR